ncbi:MAG: nuclear transport factor 2 family protein [Actinomycetota bacterium]|nr:nuclear transport factor 2 family protein [Actinomycetota bacterium]
MTAIPKPEQVADRFAIDELLDTYAHALDTKNWDLFRTLFTDDCLLDYTHEGGVRGSVDDALAWLSSALAPFDMIQHIVANRLVEIDGDEARVRAYVFSPLGLPDGSGGLTFVLSGGNYEDRLRRTPDGWRFTSRTARSAWFHAGLRGAAQPPIAQR